MKFKTKHFLYDTYGENTIKTKLYRRKLNSYNSKEFTETDITLKYAENAFCFLLFQNNDNHT